MPFVSPEFEQRFVIMFRSFLGKSLGSMLILLAFASLSYATPITATDSFGRSASVEFIQTGNSLKVRLTNTSTSAISDLKYVLEAVFFDVVDANPTFTKVSATVAPGSVLVQANGSTETNLGGEWAFKQGSLAGSPVTINQKYGISATGFGIFGGLDLFGGPELPNNGGSPPDGGAYGLVGTGAISTTNGGVNSRGFVKTSADFVFTLPSETLLSFANIRFQYGTSISSEENVFLEPIVDVPVPAGVFMAGIGGALIAAGSYLRRRRLARLA